jgi:hypothetical protein
MAIGNVAGAGFMRIGGTVRASANGDAGRMLSAPVRRHGLSMKTYAAPETLSTKKGDGQSAKNPRRIREESAKKKITESFETATAARIAAGGWGGKTREVRAALSRAITDVFAKIRKDFGQETAAEARAEILTGTELRLDAATIAMAVGKVLGERDTFLARFEHYKFTGADVSELSRMFGSPSEGEDVGTWSRRRGRSYGGWRSS